MNATLEVLCHIVHPSIWLGPDLKKRSRPSGFGSQPPKRIARRPRGLATQFFASTRYCIEVNTSELDYGEVQLFVSVAMECGYV